MEILKINTVALRVICLIPPPLGTGKFNIARDANAVNNQWYAKDHTSGSGWFLASDGWVSNDLNDPVVV